jgi:N-acyl-D-aspartate/D-glutamate deacylase
MHRLSRVLAVPLLCTLASSPALAQHGGPGPETYDLVIANGRVIDPESGLDAVRSIGIRSDRIVTIAERPLRGARVIDAAGLVVAPGFIDLHRHGQDEENYRYAVLDGVTTGLELEVGVGDVDAWYREREGGQLINYGAAVGHIPVRMAVLGDPGEFLPSGPGADQPASPEQIAEIVRRIDRGLREGAIAVGLGTAYTPAASRDEIIEVLRVAARHGASAHIHTGGPLRGIIGAIEAAAEAGAALHIVHINSTAGSRIGEMLDTVSAARARGQDVTTEAYPYAASATRIESALYDDWESQPDEWFQAFEWPETGERLTRETFAKYRAVGGTVIRHGNREENVRIAIASPLTMIASDGGPNRDGKGHPRGAGSFTRVLGRYARDEGVLTLADALAKMTIMPARRLEARVPEMKDRGRIRAGAFADLVIFDPDRVIDRATYREPVLPPDGMRYVIVNGVPVVENGRIVEGVRPGRAIRAPITAGATR